MNAPLPPRCTLARFIPEQMDVEAIKADGWREHRILVVRLDDQRLTWIERQIIESLGNRMYPQPRWKRDGIHR